MNSPTNDTIPSVDFGAFTPQASAPLAIKDDELLAMAGGVVRGLWQIPPETFAELPKRLAEIALGNNPRSATKAAKLLLEMNAQNPPGAHDESTAGVVIFLPDNGRGPRPGEFGDVEVVPSEEGASNG